VSVAPRNPYRRAALTIVAMAVVAAGGAGVRALQADGIFGSVTPGFSGSCKSVALSGVSDIALDGTDKTAFLAVRDARHPGQGDGIYALDMNGSAAPVRLPGTPKDFHPRGLSLWRAPDGSLYLAAVNVRSAGRPSIDSFTLARTDRAWTLSPQGTVMGGLLADPQDVALVGPINFYVSNGTTARNGVMRWLQTHGVLPGGNIAYFNGSLLREVVNGIYSPRGLALSADGGHLLAASLTGRMLLSLNRESFTGNLSEGENLDLPAAPDKIVLDDTGNAWVAGHARLSSWRAFAGDSAGRPSSQVFRVATQNGSPKTAEQVYGDNGKAIAGAETGAGFGKRLLIGSPLDGKLLDCGMSK
jgi:hypothetical protein